MHIALVAPSGQALKLQDCVGGNQNRGRGVPDVRATRAAASSRTTAPCRREPSSPLPTASARSRFLRPGRSPRTATRARARRYRDLRVGVQRHFRDRHLEPLRHRRLGGGSGSIPGGWSLDVKPDVTPLPAATPMPRRRPRRRLRTGTVQTKQPVQVKKKEKEEGVSRGRKCKKKKKKQVAAQWGHAAPADRAVPDRRGRARQPRDARPARRDRQLVRPPPGPPPRRRARGLRDGLQLRPAPPQRANAARDAAAASRRAPGLDPALRPGSRGDGLGGGHRRRGGRGHHRHQHGLPGARRSGGPAPAPRCWATTSWRSTSPAARSRAGAACRSPSRSARG